ncbi:hypothetical protein IU449_01915 [Nocardia higoensis]|uniref:Excreted virulence factor EspC (Type VII ESX diderm) n=1 Tax=Nocardia higoensis TaxID=228599 RepID=A0ABS0D681_9NOCA|nr:hypothetical protein [Nocardia higoensis]MBF6353313.1 hypothetical protein [Nocardia higoensis]
MTTPSQLATEFQRLAGEAAAGRLIIEFDAAERCAKWCDEYIGNIRKSALHAQAAVRIDSFGNLTSASTLGQKFYDLANGAQGSGSFTDAMREHIAIIEAMADMYRKAGAAYQACDESTRQAIQQQTNQLA